MKTTPVKIILIIAGAFVHVAAFAASTLFVIGFVAGFTSSFADAIQSADTAQSPETLTAQPPGTEPPTAQPPETPAAQGQIGETSFYNDGLEVTVTSLEEMQPADIHPNVDSLFGDKTIVVATVEIINTSEDPVDRRNGLTIVAGYVGPDREFARRVYTYGVLSPIETMIEPGATVTGQYGFAVPPSQTDDVWIDIVPTIYHDPSTWRGSAQEPAVPTA